MKSNQLKVKLLYRESKLPIYGRPGDAGIDLFAHSVKILSGTHVHYGTGIAVEVPQGYVGLLIQRSNTVKRGLRLKNCVGVIDSNFRGEIMVDFATGPSASGLYYVGDRIAQLVIVPCPTMEIVNAADLSDTNRGDKGFGSSGGC